MLGVSTTEILYLHDNPGSYFCHDCLSTLARLKKRSLRERISVVAGMTFVESAGMCSVCGKNTEVLSAHA